MVFGFKSKRDAQLSKHILITHVPTEFKANVLTLSKVPNPTSNAYSANIELYKDDLKDFSDYVSSFNTRLHMIQEIVVQPDSDSVKMLVGHPKRSSKFDHETMAFNLELIYEVPSDVVKE